MAKISIALCLMLLVALSDVYETEAQGTFSLPDYLELFPKMSKDFEPYASKGLLDFAGVLEGKSPATVEFKNFFTKLIDYISNCFKPASSGPINIQAEISEKSQQLFMAMFALNGTKEGTSFDSWRLIEGLVSMEKVSVEMKKSTSKEISSQQWDKLLGSMTEWVRRIGLFVKTVSEINGKLIDLSQFDIDIGPTYLSLSKEVGNKTQESFSLPLYLGNFPKIGKDFEPFAYKGMSDFVSDLEVKCLANVEFKDFFAKLNDYMAGFKTLSPDESYSIESINITDKAMKLFIASSALNGTKIGTSDPWRLVDGLLSMGEVLVEMENSGLKEITFEQKRELTWSMVKWARAISQFVKTASEKKGVSMDLSSFEDYYNSHVLVPAKDASTNNSSNSTKP
ncbi:uncharacterized protein LOC18012810 [Eutrema salsugineum]|uniref:uncharacterized protein LOC18012810 n=1 Tax=Eutrema salsugineum TaxID=72664 RepID=UPI000CECE681|nr:uncharacterized protein LOC18012810 [Eutrema salsugineum]